MRFGSTLLFVNVPSVSSLGVSVGAPADKVRR
jgi:hypothetical protein